jgi:hypothetical protein
MSGLGRRALVDTHTSSDPVDPPLSQFIGGRIQRIVSSTLTPDLTVTR